MSDGGMIRKVGPLASEVHANRPLTNMSVAMMQEDSRFVADKVFLGLGSASKSDTYYTFDRGYFNRDEMVKRAPGTESAGGRYSIGTDSYICDIWGFHHDVDDPRRANTDAGMDPDREAVELLTMKAKIRREKLWASTFFTTSVWTTERSGSATPSAGTSVLYWDDDDSTPVKDVADLKDVQGELTGFEPNILVLGAKTWKALKNHPDILSRVVGGATNVNAAVVTKQLVAQLFEVEEILVTKAIENTAAEGASNSHAYIGGKHALLAYRPSSPGLMTPAAGYSFNWTGYMPGTGPQGQMISTFRMEHLKSDRHEIEMAFTYKKISADLGSMFYNVVQ